MMINIQKKVIVILSLRKKKIELMKFFSSSKLIQNPYKCHFGMFYIYLIRFFLFNSKSKMYKLTTDALKNPTHLVRPVTVDPNRVCI